MITVRLAAPEDGAAIARVHVEGWQTHYRGLIPDAYLDGLDREVYTRRWAERLATPEHCTRHFTYVADDPPGTVIGFAHGSRATESDDPALGEVRAIYVLADRQGGGAGRRLAAALATRLAYLGCRRLVIWVLTENHSARKFYEALGGRPDHTRTREFGGAELPETGYQWDSLQAFMRPVVLSPPDPGWAAALAAERGRLAAALGWPLDTIEPIGSTSVPGLAAKPILDLLVGPPAFPVGRTEVLAAAWLGYDFHGENGVPGRQFFARQQSSGSTGSAAVLPPSHVHVVARGGELWQHYLRFRDYLRAHPEVAREYGALKQQLTAATGGERIAYLEGKSDFIAGVLAKAAASSSPPR